MGAGGLGSPQATSRARAKTKGRVGGMGRNLIGAAFVTLSAAKGAIYVHGPLRFAQGDNMNELMVSSGSPRRARSPADPRSDPARTAPSSAARDAGWCGRSESG